MVQTKTKNHVQRIKQTSQFSFKNDDAAKNISSWASLSLVLLLVTITMITISTATELHVYNYQGINKNDIRFPQSEVGKKAEGFWLAFEKVDVTGLEAFFKANVPPDKLQQVTAKDRAQRLLGLRQQLGKELRLLKIISPSPEEISLIIANLGNEMFKLNLLFEKQDNKLWLKGLAVDEAGPEDLAPPLPAMNIQQALQGIEQEIAKAVREDRFSGVVLVAKNFTPIFFKSYGLASKEFSVPNRPDTRFNLGSINKIFTKIAIAQLAQEGKLSLDDKLGKFLPYYPNAEAREKVTVRHLVNMTSGIGDFFGPEFEKTPKDLIRHNRDYLQFFASKPLAFEPGTRQMYSNGGYVVLGEIISVAAEMDYYNYVRKNIFEAAEMKESDWFEADSIVPNLAEGYTRKVEGPEDSTTQQKDKSSSQQQPEKQSASQDWRKNIYTRPARGSAAGGGYATAEDLLRFIRALYECRLLNEAWTNWVFTGQEPGPQSTGPVIDDSPARSGSGENNNIPSSEPDSEDGLSSPVHSIRENEPLAAAPIKTQTSAASSFLLMNGNRIITTTKEDNEPSDNPENPDPGQSNQSRIDRSRWSLGIAGGAPGINAALEFEAQTGFTIIVLGNYDPPAATQMARMIRRYLGAVKN
ncbi:MAG: serine hydrolase domain-containing protein [Candidatus Saccharicenans sp.]|jgi:CubicO group peptidase (beta-lactamase class C family)|nr:beta-lactamase family protein [Candidatus Saccharicenans sp.]MDH7575121.1 serine hydrolase domain-containing protein [Candidatus Saccharicenans sp.]